MSVWNCMLTRKKGHVTSPGAVGGIFLRVCSTWIEMSPLHTGEASASFCHLNKVNIVLCCSRTWKWEESIYTFFQLPAFIPNCLCSVCLCKLVCVFPSVVLQTSSWISPSLSCDVALQLTSIKGSPASNAVQDRAMSAPYLHSRSLGILLFFFFLHFVCFA